MFRRSCTSVFRQCVKSSPKPTISRTMFFQRIYCSGSETSKPSDPIDGSSKRVSIVLEKSDGRISKEIGYVNERLFDMIRRIDEDKNDFHGFGACGGCTECATCHVIFREKDFHKLQPANDDEQDQIFEAPENCEFSRLACNIYITEEMEGMVVKFPSVIADYKLDESNGN